MTQKKQTIFQRLNRVLDIADDDRTLEPQVNRYAIDDKELLRTQSKEEYEFQKLQSRQNKYLGNMWTKVESESHQKALQYEISRIAAYADFEMMEAFPEISAALDIFMEESTTNNRHGRVLNIYSESPRIKGILDDLFYNRLDIHVSIPMWIRNMVKYGDDFLFLNIDATKGIIGCKQLPNFEIERRELGLFDSINNLNKIDSKKRTSGDEKVRFYWRGKDLEFMHWQVAHFRLLGDDRRLPYGTSALEKCRRIWRQLMMAEDAMLINRMIRAQDRRVYKVYVGNIDEDDVQAYVNEVANRFKRKSIVDPKTGQVDLRFNMLGVDQDIFIPVRSEDAPTPIDTLVGSSNTNDIADIDYLHRKLFTSLRVPKAFLNFDEGQGEGKNLALLDIRFSRTINRIQQAVIQELNKIAIIHLALLGFDEEIDNFVITMNNPSTQSEMLRVQNDQSKATLSKDLLSDPGTGIQLMSQSRVMREIWSLTDEEIKQNLLEIRMEKAVAIELENTGNVIKHTGLFDKVDKLYGDISVARTGGGDIEGGGTDGDGGSFGGGGFGGGGAGGDADIDLEDLGIGEEGDDTESETEDGDSADTAESETEDSPDVEEAKRLKNNNLLTEIINHKKTKKPIRLLDRTLRVNSEIETMLTEMLTK